MRHIDAAGEGGVPHIDAAGGGRGAAHTPQTHFTWPLAELERRRGLSSNFDQYIKSKHDFIKKLEESFAPTSFTFEGRVWGILICWEGMYPDVSLDFSQMDALVREQNATALLWSVGVASIVLQVQSKLFAKKYGVSVVAATDLLPAIDEQGGVIFAPGGRAAPFVEVHLPAGAAAALGYTGKASVRHALLPN